MCSSLVSGLPDGSFRAIAKHLGRSAPLGARASEYGNGRRPLLKRTALRHLIVAGSGALVAYLFWLTRADWDPEMRFWKAIGNASLILLYATLAAGPLARLRLPGGRLVRYRREMGVWFALFGLLHTVLILNGWARWDLQLFLGYEFVPQLGRLVRLEPGFGLANLIGIVSGVIALVLLATSSDWAVRKLGGESWKFLHRGVYIILALVMLHTGYFLFIHYTPHFHRLPPPPDWFRYPFVGLTLAVLVLQAAAFVWTVQTQRRRAVPDQASAPERQGSRAPRRSTQREQSAPSNRERRAR
jgi:methionine sulfoxide reductase heme-binding subunit